MKPIYEKELKAIQLDVLQVVHDYCVANNIKYSLGCGTMLGAARHKGYIPWDDDIDIYMPRLDYERLIESFPSTLSNIKIVSLERDPKWNRSYAQAYDSRTVLIENAVTPYDIGIYIDIYPIDQVPDDDNEWMSYNKKRRILIRMYEIKYLRFRKKRSLFKNLFLVLNKIILLPFSSRTIAQYISNYAQKYNGKGYKRSFECVQGMLQKSPFASSLMEETVLVPFEDRLFMAMKNYHSYLTNGYGNYMQLPPKEKQVGHHEFEAYWK